MKLKRVTSICFLVILIFILTGCQKNLVSETKNDENEFNIITSFYPMYVATANIIDGIENVSLECLASPEVGCLHDYQLTVKDMMKLENANVFVINGKGMESFLDKAISVYPQIKIIDASEAILEEETHNSDGHSHTHDHLHGSDNPHVWVSIDLHIHQIEQIANELAKIDYINKEKYQENARKYISELKILSKDMHEEIELLPSKNIITFHEAFHYFAEDFRLNVVAVIEREPGTSPSARDVANIIDTVKSNDVNAIFVEPQYLKTAANTIANETNINVYELDPVTSGPFEKDAYISIMKKNLEVLKEALK